MAARVVRCSDGEMADRLFRASVESYKTIFGRVRYKFVLEMAYSKIFRPYDYWRIAGFPILRSRGYKTIEAAERAANAQLDAIKSFRIKRNIIKYV